MSKIRLTKEFHFEMAHLLWNYDGPCKNIHGHSYKLFVTVIGKPIDDISNPKYGMLIDFTDLKNIVNSKITSLFDHAFVLMKNKEFESVIENNKIFGKKILLDYQPTSENLVIDFANRLKPYLPKNVKLHSLKLYETATSFAEWYAEDNK
ncbi:MAG: 6-carboxytetrahydropterin synthase QueD [Bacteroidetes bacterium]|nr:MAG: 6-carboxytetrahydropterin synthase QueD [Bacteroidota bacterium]